MNRLERIMAQVQQALDDERNLERRLDDFVDTAANLERSQAPELARITLLHSDVVRARLEKSRRFWQKMTKLLRIIAIGLMILLILK